MCCTLQPISDNINISDRVMLLLMALLRSLGPKQILKLSLGLFFSTREFTQSVGLSTRTIMPCFTISSSSFFNFGCNHKAIFLEGVQGSLLVTSATVSIWSSQSYKRLWVLSFENWYVICKMLICLEHG